MNKIASQYKTNKFISALLIIAVVLPTVLFPMPKKAKAQWAVFDAPLAAIETVKGVFQGTGAVATVGGFALKIKDFAAWLLRQILMRIAKAILAKITQATINWINGGFHGSPLFLENPGSFFRDIAKSEVRTLVDMIGYDTFRFPFGKDTALNIIDSYKRQLAINGQYTLSKVMNNQDAIRYRNDFSYGGWNGFLINTQYPQNNYLGFQGIVQQNLASRLQGTLKAPAEKVQAAIQQGMGFLSPQTCPSNPSYNNGVNEFLRPSYKPPTWTPPSVRPGEDAAALMEVYQQEYDTQNIMGEAAWSQKNTCPGGLVSTTPGAVVGSQITMAMSSSLRQTELGAALGNSIDAIFDALINKMMDTGLNMLKSAINPGSGENNWSYEGQTLSGTTSYGSTNTVTGTLDINIPQQSVSLTANPSLNGTPLTTYDASKNISGGTAPYGIVSGSAVVSQKPILATGSSTVIAIATITRDTNGTKLTISGRIKGVGSFVLRDSSLPPKNVVINIAVNNAGDLVASPANISINVNETATTAISGGEGSYTIQTPPLSSVALVDFAGTNLVITAVARGSTSVVVQDSSTPKKSVTINISVAAPEELRITDSQNLPITNITVARNNIFTATITGGTSPYRIDTVLDTTIATAGINNSTLSILGVAGGQTAVIITDSAAAVKITTLNITVTAPATELLGNCVSTNSQRTTQATCEIIGGIWTADIAPPGGTSATSQPQGICSITLYGSGYRGSTTVVPTSSRMTQSSCNNIRDQNASGNVSVSWAPLPNP